ncbi:kinetochore-microtubule binding complex subunit SPC105 [Aspergillus affinis]|uniref:kinetochore-microtubule binding complex subunit SPC105 n=1 Tax=Aspergillus affinis TaxID=1070780 RepID=UPI0022FF2619|nr:Spc7-domain-containing protein [Aspergillus affinis]KAI9038549.1 Spc7-domain-containing protein [Aspergillus affinis]
MASRGGSAGSARPRSRRSIAHVPRSKLTAGLEKENTIADISSSQPVARFAKLPGKDKKSRSKSLGPGGLDALQDSNGNRRKSTAALPLKSILKPTVPVSPVRNIPSFEETRKRTPARGAPQSNDGRGANNGSQGLLIDLDTPAQPSAPSSSEERANPFDGFNAEAIRDEMAAVREREEQERRERERKAILQQREARRKSMANRRVSFAPEATLHTWNVVEIPDDSTSSSTSNSTRRASNLANTEAQEPAQAPQAEPASSPNSYAESDIAFSPVQYPDLERLKNGPTHPGYDAVGSSQDMSSSPFSGSSMDGTEDVGMQDSARDDDDDDDDDNSSTSGFEGESTAMSLDDMTVRSAATVQSDASESTTSSNRLNDALRQAAREAGTQSFDDDEDGDMSMEIADQEITGAFQPWIKKGERQSFDWEDISARHDQENVEPANPAEDDNAFTDAVSEMGEDDLSMEVTNAIGGILSKSPGRRKSVARRKSTSEETSYDEQTMELTNVVGGIAQAPSPAKSIGAESNNEDEEMTMEFTSVVGGVLKKFAPGYNANEENSAQPESADAEVQGQNLSGWDNDDDAMEEGTEMEITGAVGGILPADEEPNDLSQEEEGGNDADADDDDDDDDEDQTAGMEVTTAMGQILPPEMEVGDKDQAKKVMEMESDAGHLGSSPFQESARQSPAKSPVSFHVAAVASESGSPSLASVRSRRMRQSLSLGAPNTPTSQTPEMPPSKQSVTPPKQLTPQVSRPETPGKTPPSSNRKFPSASPKKLFQPELQESVSKPKSPGRKSLFGASATGESTPLFILQPHRKRHSSGLGIDKEGLGSPRVAAMLDKRRTIGDEAPEFVPQKQSHQGVRFEDPVKLHEEVDREREEEENREDGHIPPLQDATANLKDMISSLTPKKNKLKGRKSLHVGAARGLLGKRPAELDQDDEELDNTPKRLRSAQASPVKSIKLPAPPTKDETVGRRSPRKTIGTSTPSKSPLKMTTTPTQVTQNDRVAEDHAEAATPRAEPADDTPAEDPGPEFDPIQLQDFLNMTNIHFMELDTTKRRHTIAPDSTRKRAARLSSDGDRSSAANFEDCVAAGICTVPMLELYQHSCRELKSYISEGRQVIRSIETETFADNPPLFREYMTAAPDIRLLMDNQFRNVKTHARLLSKATWYEWRMKLLEGLKEGLNGHVEELKADEDRLSKHETLLNDIVPALTEKHAALEGEATTLQQLADEMENCDQEELRGAREKLSTIEEEIEAKKKQLKQMQAEVQEKTNTLEIGAEAKAEFVAQIEEAERVKAECRGWNAKEISELKDSVHKIERQTGWSIVSATSSSMSPGPVVTMSYRAQLDLTFHPGAFYSANDAEQSSSNSDEKMGAPIELKYHPRNGAKAATQLSKLSSIALLVLKSLQNHIANLSQPKVAPKHLLHFISEAWDLMLNLEEEARMLEFCGVTKLKLSESDDQPSLRARCTILQTLPAGSKSTTKAPSASGPRRIDVDFAVKTRVISPADSAPLGSVGVLDFETNVLASKVYGFQKESGMSEPEMQKLLSKELGAKSSGLQLGGGVWSKAIQMLTGKAF